MSVELNNNHPQDTSILLLETMCSLKVDLKSTKEHNERLVKASKELKEKLNYP